MKSKRIEAIEAFVQSSGSASFADLERQFGVSLNTLRRDVAELVSQGKLEKVYGGVRAKKHTLLSYETRDDIHHAAKVRIGQAAAQLIEEGDIIFIDSGTTTSQILPFIKPQLHCTILTNNFDVIDFCTRQPNLTLYALGTRYNFKTRSFVGLSPQQAPLPMNVNKAFMAATGITLKNGLTNSDVLEQQIKKEICSRAHEIILLADQSKFGHTTLMTYSPLENVQTVISDGNLAQDYLIFFKENQIKLIKC